ncbi:hypothetical protein C9374_004813 [Naegleria lovaniensis]|uniref:Uncharacterized protein n=1 Tax=Naegleria lovaniensis TaxID=51637 RepID=A0AA88GKV9_NAELO|nr:uncharacterized protein C9374_004813 [Naegleria lovaniensis]KAG2382846.1 hypothetical protein C9374_004813 [Naegleria lovaniensis]
MKSVTPNDTTKGQSSPSRNGAGAVSAISQRSDSSPSSSIQQPSPQRIEKRKRGRPRKEHPIVQFPVQWEFRDGTVHHRHATGVSSSNRSRSSSSMGDSSIQIFNYYHDQASNHMQYCNLNEASPENYSSMVNHTSMTSSASMERSNPPPPPPPPCSHPQRSVRQIFSFQNVNFPTLRKRSNSNKSGNSSPSKMSSSSTTSSNGSLHSNGGSSSSKKSPTRSSPISMTISNTTLFSTSTWNMTPQQQQQPQIQQHPSIVSNLANRTRTNSNNTFDPATLVTNSTTPVPIGNSSVSTFSIIAPSQGVESSFQQAIANTHEASSTPNPERKRPMKGRTHISLKDILN